MTRLSDSSGSAAASEHGTGESRRSFTKDAGALPMAAIVAVLVVWCWSVWRSPPYSPDSWAYYELSQSIWRDGFRLMGLRSYGYPAAAPSGAFPPLWPALWSLVDALTGLGARAGLVAAFGCIPILAIFSEAIGRQLSGAKWVGFAATAGLLATPGFADEVEAARSIPIQMALVSALVWTLLRPGPIDRARAAALGMICGALALARFDMLVFAASFGLILLLISRSLGAAVAFGMVFLVVISPWVTVSWLWFGELFHSDSSFVAKAIDPHAFVTDWYPPASHQATLSDDPAAWAAKVAGNMPPFLSSAALSPGALGNAALAAALAALLMARRGGDKLPTSFRTADTSVRRFAAIAPAVLVPLPLYMVTGYFDGRYFSLLFWYLLLAASASAASAWLRRASRSRVESSLMLLSLGLLLIGACANVASGLPRPPEPHFPELQNQARIETCLQALGAHPTDRILFQDDALAARWAAVRRLPAAMLPRNFRRPGLSSAEKGQFLSEYGIRFLIGEPQVLEPLFKPLLHDTGLKCGPTVYRVAPAGA